MKSTLTLLATIAGTAVAQGVTSKVSPHAAAPTGCSPSYESKFEITVAKVAAKRSLERRADCGGDGVLVVSLSDNVLTDSQGRTGYIASNYQFQFDEPPQAGAIYTAGFSLCGNESLALGGSTTFYQCQSGSFWNLYDRSWAAQCEPVEILAIPCGEGSSAVQVGDGQVVATEVITTTVIKPLSDGQPQVLTTTIPIPMCQIGDGQVQAKTTPCASITAVATSSAVPVSQYSDGQIQVTAPGTASTPAPATTAVSVPVVASSAPGTVVLPTETAPVNSTIITAVSSATLVATSAPPVVTPASGASSVKMSSLAALVVGLVGAVAFL